VLITAADRWSVRPGRVLSWEVTADAAAPVRPAPLSVNQVNHLGGAAGEPTIWLAASFEIEGPVDEKALRAAYLDLIARHSTLQCAVHQEDDGWKAVRHDPRRIVCTAREPFVTVSTEDTTARLRELLDHGCTPESYPAFALAAVSRVDTSTVVCGFDHLHVDAHSIAIVVRDMYGLYLRHRGGNHELPVPGCFVSRAAEWAAEPRLSPEEPRLRVWQQFFDAVDYRLPPFPLPLGLDEGERAEQRTEVRLLADPELAAEAGRTAQYSGTTTYGAVLTTLARALRNLGGPAEIPVLMPVQTRQAEDENTVGWFTTTVPVRAHTEITRTAINLDQARVLATLPLDQVLASLPRPLRWERRDLFMISYVDYRRLPGACDLVAVQPHHVSATAPTDEVQIWVARTFSGLAVRVRHPATREAGEIVTRLIQDWSDCLSDFAAYTAAPEDIPSRGGPPRPAADNALPLILGQSLNTALSNADSY
jgi:hypothetical protein